MNEPVDDAQPPAARSESASAAPVPAPAAEAPAPPETVTIQCPSCDAKLQKVTLTPGVKVNCLHCGARFFPANVTAPDQAAAGGTIFPEPAQPKMREPKSPGYWLLRIPAVLAMTAGLFVVAIIAWNEFRPQYMDRLEYWLAVVYVPLIALAGVFAFLASRALARIDAGMTSELWSRGLLREPLPPMPGSSLPYIAPFALVGGFLPVFFFGFGDEHGEQVFGGALFGAALFLLGFMAEDLRQFLWRQHSAAEVIAPPGWRDRNQPYGASPYPWTAFACAAGFGMLALLEFYVAWHEWDSARYSYYASYIRSELMLYISIGLTCIAAAITGFMLCCDADRAAASWLRTARAFTSEPKAVIVAPLTPQLGGLSRLAAVVPIFWVVYGALWMLFSAVAHHGRGSWEVGVWLLLSVSSCGLALWFSRLMRQFAAWRWAKETAYSAIRKHNEPKSAAFVTGWPGAVIRLTLILAAVQVGLMVIQFLIEATRFSTDSELLFAIPLIVGIANYPTLFVVAMTREFMAVEQHLAKQKSDED